MTGPPRVLSLEERLAALREKMEDGLPRRAADLRSAAARLASGDSRAREELARLAHKLRGTAGTHGHAELDERATELEALARGGAEDHVLCGRALLLVAAISRVRTSSASAPPEPVRAASPEATAREAGALRGIRVLAIDDDSSTRRLLQLTLCSLGGADAEIVSSPERALETFAPDRFDLVVVDAMMPTMTGIAFAGMLRASTGDHGVPIAFLSAATQDELGWTLPPRSTWLRKPFRPAELLAELRAIVVGTRD